MHCAVFSQKDIDLLQLVLDLPCVAAGEQHEQIERILIELEFSFFGAPPDNFGRFFLPATAAGIEPIKNLYLRSFDQRLVKPTPFVHFGSADQERKLRPQTALEQIR